VDPVAYAPGSRLLAWSDRTRQSTVIYPVIVVPQGLTKLNTATQDFDLFLRTRRSVGRQKSIVHHGIEILVVPVLENGLENVLAQTAHAVKTLRLKTPIELFVHQKLFDFSFPNYLHLRRKVKEFSRQSARAFFPTRADAPWATLDT
jgi:hypothetical protein